MTLKDLCSACARRVRLLFSQALNFPGWRQAGRRIPKPSQLLLLPRVLTFRERVALGTGFLLVAAGFFLAVNTLYLRNTVTAPAEGGTFTEGIASQVLFINPVIPGTLADRDLIALTYAGLLRYDAEGKLVPDLAERYAVGEQGKIIEFAIRQGVSWPDGKPFTADDVVFTVELVQNPATRSPFFTQWLGVKAEALDARTVRFTLPSPFAPFLHATTLGILPKHLWGDTEPENLSLSELNLRPVGLGPFTVTRFERTRDGTFLSFSLKRNGASPRRPLLDRVVIRLFDTPDDALAAFTRQELDATGGGLEPLLVKTTLPSGAVVHRVPMPRIFSVYFNQTLSRALLDSVVRKALAHTTNKEALLEMLGSKETGQILNGPLPPGISGFTTELPLYDFAPKHAANILEAGGFTLPEDSKVRRKGEEPNIIEFRFTITTAQGELETVAQALAEQWRVIGAAVDVQALPAAELREAMQQRSYTALLIGVDVLPDPDLFSLFHSSQKFDPGRNFALYDNKNVDTLLAEGRTVQDAAIREGIAQRAQQLIMEEVPALFLWSDRLEYLADNRIKGMELRFLPSPHHRFANVHEWYVKTKRVPR